MPYTLNAPADFRAANAAGVDALITDDPTLAARTLGLSRAELAPEALEPVARIRAPRYASDTGTRPRFRIRLAAVDRGSGVAGLRLQYRRSTEVATRWRPVLAETRAPSVIFRGRPGRTYRFRLRARDRLSNFSPYVYARTVVPLDDRSRRLRFSGGWARAGARRAYGGTLRRARRFGASMSAALPGNPGGADRAAKAERGAGEGELGRAQPGGVAARGLGGAAGGLPLAADAAGRPPDPCRGPGGRPDRGGRRGR